MAERPEPMTAARPAVERRIVSVLFADLVGFTTLSEQMDAEEVAAIQDAYFASVREAVARYGGVLEKFIGDAAMAVFGAPHARDDDAERAVRAGLALIGGVEQLGARLGLAPGQLQLRVGVNSGEVVHATDGPDAGRVTGDTVNTAARLQAAAEPNRVLIGELTALAVRGAIELTEMGPISLKGKAEPVRAWQADAVRPEPSRDAALGGLRAPMLGRHEELARLAGLRGGRVTIIAPPGVGKSRLMTEVARSAEAGGARVVRARVRPQAASPYEPVAELLAAASVTANLASALASLPADAREVVEREVRWLSEPTPIESVSAQDLSARREVRFTAWLDALRLLLGDAAVILIVEDVHWADADLLAFLDRAATDDRPLFATARPSILESAPDWVAAADVLELATLPGADAAELIRNLIGDALPDELLAAVAERSDGNPLFIEELLRTWISVGTLVRGDDGWRLAAQPEQVALPGTVQAIYAAQLDDLPGDARMVARRASVAGRRFADAALTPLELADRRDGLEVLRRRAFVAGPQPDPTAGDVYAYRHALLRDAGYASLARAERARLHVALARWLEATAGERAGQVAQLIAEHYADAAASVPAIGGEGPSRAALNAAAADWFERAAHASLAMAAPASAVRLLARAVEMTAPDAGIDRARRRLRRGQVLADSAELDLAVEEMTAAVGALGADVPATEHLYAEAAYSLAKAYMQQIRFPEAESLTATALEQLDATHEPAGTARLTALHAWAVSAQGRQEGVADEARRAREMARSLGDPEVEVDVLEHYAAAMNELDVSEADVWEELERRARGIGRWRVAVIASRINASMLEETDRSAALALTDASAELARTHGLTEQQGWSDLARAEIHLVGGNWDAALEAGERGIGLAERYAYERLGYRMWMVVLPMLAARRDGSWNARFDAWWAVARAHFPAQPSPYGATLNAAARLWTARAAGEPLPTDLPPLPEAQAFIMAHFLAAREILAEALIAAGEPDTAADLVGAEPEADWSPLMRASHALVSAWVAAARGGAGRAEAEADAAVAHARVADAPWWLARALRAQGDRDAARDLERSLGIPG